MTCGPLSSLMSYTKKRCCTPTCEAASPAPFASYIVSYIASTSFTSAPSMSVTGAVGRLSTGSPKSRIVWVGIDPCYRCPARVRSWEEIEAGVTGMKRALIALVVIGAIALVVLGGIAWSKRSDAESLNRQTARAASEQQQLDKQAQDIKHSAAQ